MWNVLLSFSGLVALIQLLFLPFFPESPPYLLLQKGDKAGCLKGKIKLYILNLLTISLGKLNLIEGIGFSISQLQIS